MNEQDEREFIDTVASMIKVRKDIIAANHIHAKEKERHQKRISELNEVLGNLSDQFNKKYDELSEP